MKVSILDAFEHGPTGGSVETLRDAIALAQHAEAAGLHRYWMVEHHNVAFEPCPAPEVMVAAVASATRSIRVGTGGILLNNYSPYKVAELGRTLMALYGDRIDLGFGRSVSGPGPDYALKRDRAAERRDDQQELIAELVSWLSLATDRPAPFEAMQIMPDLPAGPAAWSLCGSVTSGAFAGGLGLNLAVSGFHKPELVPDICAAYRAAFKPAGHLAGCEEPRIMLAVMGAVARTKEEAALQFAPMRWANSLRRTQGEVMARLPTEAEALSLFGGVIPEVDEVSARFTVCSIAELRDHMAMMREEHGVGELLFRLGVADPKRKREMVDLLAEGLLDL